MPRPWFVQQPAWNCCDVACVRLLRGFSSPVGGQGRRGRLQPGEAVRTLLAVQRVALEYEAGFNCWRAGPGALLGGDEAFEFLEPALGR